MNTWCENLQTFKNGIFRLQKRVSYFILAWWNWNFDHFKRKKWSEKVSC